MDDDEPGQSVPRSRAFAQVDVFADTPLMGNPVAVVLDSEGLTDEDMHRLARWTNLSETTFLTPPTTPSADYHARIFTPGGELPFAGHPTLGSAHAWLETGGTPRDPRRLVQECDAGLIDVHHDDHGAFSFTAPPTRRTGELEDAYLEEIVTAFGIEHAQVISHQWVDNGPGWAVVRLATARDVIDLDPDLARIPNAMVGAIGAHPDGSKHDFEMRTFAPGAGVPEDPACGSMNASVGQWLLRTGAVTDTYRVSQGTRLGRAATITVSPQPDGSVRIGGRTTTLIRGTLVL